MRHPLIEKMKCEIETSLRDYVREEGIELYIAANDNPASSPFVELESFADIPLTSSRLLAEIKVVLGILGKPWQCKALAQGLYEALHPHQITQRELAVLLMCMHIETAHCVRPRHVKKRMLMRYIVEVIPANDATEAESLQYAIDTTECC